MRLLRILHRTVYAYSTTVRPGPHRLFLRPRDGHDLRVAASELHITPAHRIGWHRDPFDNSVAEITFEEATDRLEFASSVTVEHYDETPLDFVIADRAARYPFVLEPGERLDLLPFMTPVLSIDDPAIDPWLNRFRPEGDPVDTFALIDRINRTIAADFRYRRREEPGVQRPAQTLALGSGSCRDVATLFMETCRHLGIPARFVSGYLANPAPGDAHGSTHAWAEVYLPGAGWKGFDSTGGAVTGTDHIAVAVARHPERVPPVSGTFEADVADVTSELTVEVSVETLAPAPEGNAA